MDLDSLLGPDPFGDDPDAAARWTLECMAIERRIRAALRPIPDDRSGPRTGGSTGSSSSGSKSDACSASGVYPVVVLDDGSERASADAYSGSPFGVLSETRVADALDPEETFDGSL